jgi:DNA-binding response OmpR family regulator
MMSDHEANILVVDDEAFFREAIGDILDEHGLEYVMAETGEDALALAESTHIGVVVLDIRLPGMDGIEVLARLRELRPTLRVIMLSASTDQELVLEALRLGATDYLAKPLHDEELVLAVRRGLETHRMASEWTRLRGRLDRLVTRMQELNAEAIEASPDALAEVLALGAVTAASDVLEATKTSLMLLDEESDTLRVVAAVGHSVEVDEMDFVAAGEGVAGIALKRSEPLVVEDVNSDPLFGGFTQTERYASDSFAVAPLMGVKGAFGVLCATDRSGGGRFGDEDLSLLRLLALQIADLVRPDAPPLRAALSTETQTLDLDQTVVEQLDYVEPDADAVLAARLAEAPPKSDDDDELDRDAEIARLICQAMIEEVEPERVLAGALKPLSTLLPAAPVSLYLLDPSRRELVLEVECDGGVGNDHPVLPATGGLTGSVLQSGILIATDEPGLDPRFDVEIDAPVGGSARAFMCLPISLRGKVVGVVRAFLQEGVETSARTGEVVAAALAAAVRNALLYRSLVESIEEVAEARRSARL